MGDQYGLPDLRQLMAGRTHFPVTPQPQEPFFVHRIMTPPPHYEPFIVGEVLPRGVVEFGQGYSTCATPTTTTANTSAATTLCGLEMEGGYVGGDGGNSRWPRQETLTLLEIRSCLDYKFKEANHKGPLWDEVARIMGDEHGYQRSGKKCREKFENLYKYYKKTKEGKAGRHDGKHYRFFRQLEAIYGETSNQSSIPETALATNTLPYHKANITAMDQAYQDALQDQKLCESFSFSNSPEFETSSSENNDDDLSAIAFMMNQSMDKKQRVSDQNQICGRVRKNWKVKVKDFVELQMRKLEETQEAWMEKMLKTIDHKEQERMFRDEEWRKQEVARLDREHEFWAKERASVEARDVALMEALKKCTGKGLDQLLWSAKPMSEEIQNHYQNHDKKANERLNDTNRWTELEISSLIQLRTSLEPRFQESGNSQEGPWEEIVAKMACLGYDRSAVECKEKWENMNIYFNQTRQCKKKLIEDSKTSIYFQHLNSSHGHEIGKQYWPQNMGLQLNNDSISSSNSNEGFQVHDSCFHILTEGGEHLWEKYRLKLSKGKQI